MGKNELNEKDKQDLKDKQTLKDKQALDQTTSSVLDKDQEKKKAPLLLKILAVLLMIAAVVAVPSLVLVVLTLVMAPELFGNDMGIVTFVIAVVQILALLVSSVLGAAFGLDLIRNKTSNIWRISEILIVATIVSMLCDLMLQGLEPDLITYLVRLVIIVVIATYIDPTLAEERKVQRKLRDMELREDAEEGTLGRDESGKGYIKLDFFNLFWIFVLACIFGVIVETTYCGIMFGVVQDRAGMLYGPFSPIYGFGAVLMTVAFNRLYDNSILIVFFLSAVIGGAFEYAVSWFMEFSFGIVAWDYSGTFLSIDGRTNAMFMLFWGILGCVWIKLLLPYVLKLVNLIPWNWRYTVTTVCATLMIANGILTLAAYDSWYKRQAGHEPSTALEEFCDEYYDDTFMEDRFQTMSIDPSKSTRSS